MINTQFINALAEKLTQAIPPELGNIKGELEKNFASIVQAHFAKLDLVTREEFDAQVKVLKRSREKLEALEKKLESLN